MRPHITFSPTNNPHQSDVTRIKSGTCAIFQEWYLGDVSRVPKAFSGDEASRLTGSGWSAGEGSGVQTPIPADPDDHANPGWWSQSRASSTPTRRLGVQCERSVRDPIRIAAPARMNQVGWPSGLGMEAEAPSCPPDRRNSQPVAGGRRTVAKAPTSGNSCAGRPSQPSAGRPFLFSGPSSAPRHPYRRVVAQPALCLASLHGH